MNIQQFRAMLPINKHGLDDALMIHADVLDQISQQVRIAAREMAAAARYVKQVEAQVFVRCKAAGDSDKLADQQSRIAPECDAAFREWQRCISEHGEWADLYECWKTRGFDTKELVTLYVAQYFAIDPLHNLNRRTEPRPPRRDYSIEREQRATSTEPTRDTPRRKVVT